MNEVLNVTIGEFPSEPYVSRFRAIMLKQDLTLNINHYVPVNKC